MRESSTTRFRCAGGAGDRSITDGAERRREARDLKPDRLGRIFLADERGGSRQRRGMPSSTASSSWEEYAKTLGIELQRRRIALDVTQENLAHRAGLTRTHYQQLERGFWKPGSPANPSLKMLVRLAQALQLEVAELLPSGRDVQWPDT